MMAIDHQSFVEFLLHFGVDLGALLLHLRPRLHFSSFKRLTLPTVKLVLVHERIGQAKR
jgi:hypothetical protein